MSSAARAATAIAGPLVLPETGVGMIEQSTTRRLAMPCTRQRPSTTEMRGSVPIEQVPVPFSITYAQGALESGRRYAVQATIAQDGRIRFRTTTVHVVPAEGAGATPMAILVQPVR